VIVHIADEFLYHSLLRYCCWG